MTRYALPQPFEELDHTGDLGVMVRGASDAEALARLLLALSQLLAGGAEVKADHQVVITAPAGDRASMAVDLLRELLYRFASEREIAQAVEVVRFEPDQGATLQCDMGRYDPELHAGSEIKAVTLHDRRFEPNESGWLAQVIFDV